MQRAGPRYDTCSAAYILLQGERIEELLWSSKSGPLSCSCQRVEVEHETKAHTENLWRRYF